MSLVSNARKCKESVKESKVSFLLTLLCNSIVNTLPYVKKQSLVYLRLIAKETKIENDTR